MNIDYLYYFMDVAKTKSITRAAKLNFISPQGMSRAMNELEKELGCQLLVRFSNKLELSEAGEKIAPYISQTIESYSRLLDFATSESHVTQTEDRSILLECQNVAMLAFLTQEAKDYVIASDAIHFRECQNTQIRYDLLASAESPNPAPTIGLVCFFRQNHGSSLDGINDLEKAGFLYRPFLRTYDKVMVNAKCPLANKEKLTDADIVEKRIACTNTELSTLLANRFGRDAIVLSSADWSLRRRMVESDSAVTFLPAIATLTMDDNEENFALRDMDNPYGVEIGFVGAESSLEADAFKTLMGILRGFYLKHENSGLFTLCD